MVWRQAAARMIPIGIYALTLSLGIILGAVLAFTGKDQRMWWPAGAMLLSLLAARTATALPDAALPILLVSTPITALVALRGGNRASRVIAIAYLPRLACYIALAWSLIPRWAMWEFSNAFLVIQIGALIIGTLSGGHIIRDWLGLGSRRTDRVAGAVSGAAQVRRETE